MEKLGFKKVIMSGVILGVSLLWANAVRGQTYYVQPGDSLYLIAARYGTTIAALQQANSLTTSSIYPGQALTLSPTVSSSTAGSGITTSLAYITCPGDTLYLIAQRYGITVTQLQQANNLTGDALLTGVKLMIPTATNSGATSMTHQVQTGESLYLIAQKYGITVAALKAANLLTDTLLLVGQALTIPTTDTTTGATDKAVATVTYLVKSGDSIYYIAKQYGITMDVLLQANCLSSGSVLYPGQKLIIPEVATQSVTAVSSSGTVYGKYVISQSDLELFAQLVSAESGGETFEGQVAVAATILNRLIDTRYPKTISGIIYQVVDGYYQYSPVLDGRINETATASAYQAVRQAIAGWDPSNGANGFYNPIKTTSQWVRSQTVTATIGNHVFFSY